MKKAVIWVSAVMYIALGVVILTIVIAAGMPVITRMRDKYTALETKDLMFKLDDNIRTVLSEGPGSKRPVVIQIGRGDFVIYDKTSTTTPNTIKWSMKTKALLSQPGTTIPEGNLNIKTTTDPNVQGEYTTEIWVDYTGTSIELDAANIKVLTGKYNLIIQNIGINPTTQKITVSITQAT